MWTSLTTTYICGFLRWTRYPPKVGGYNRWIPVTKVKKGGYLFCLVYSYTLKKDSAIGRVQRPSPLAPPHPGWDN
eukprot:scaffold325689_cov61-Tisochrysis_lutea.AAC.1